MLHPEGQNWFMASGKDLDIKWYVALQSAILSIKSYFLVFNFSHWIFLSINMSSIDTDFMKGSMQDLYYQAMVNGYDWGTFS